MKQFFLRFKREIVSILVTLLVFFVLLCGGIQFGKTHFLLGTMINGVNCSFLSINDAIEKISNKKEKTLVTFVFSNGKKYEVSLNKLGMQVNTTKIEKIFKQQHANPNENRTYKENVFSIASTKTLENYLKSLPELQLDNLQEPQDAYIDWNGQTFSICGEIPGNIVCFEDALKLSIEELNSNNNCIDFTSITKIYPNVRRNDLSDEFNNLNNMLNSSICYELSNGNVVRLDSTVICNWVYKDDNGNFQFDIENGVSQFIEELATKVNEANSTLYLKATDTSTIVTVNVPFDVRAQLDLEAESERVKLELGNFEQVYLKPIYDRTIISEQLTSYVELDISRQHLWFYLNGSLLLDTDCVTGNVRDNYDTPTGVYFLTNKVQGAILRGYNKDGSKYESPVDYWMPFYRGYGLHDASWRNTFGGNIYLTSGSHGCVNLPKEKAKQLYENIDYTMPIIIYKSET